HPVRGVMTVNPVLCQGCGACTTACPSGAISIKHFTFDQTMVQIDVLSDFGEPTIPTPKAEVEEVAA
ncbi:MAG: 4Fe-4S binding protein, partial [Anaerolineales bacterium]|nr:4Fe-4S binding protein [Anaerolineales bacterium]